MLNVLFRLVISLTVMVGTAYLPEYSPDVARGHVVLAQQA